MFRVLVALDGSSFAESALPAAVAIARTAAGEIRLLSVLEMPPIFAFPEHYTPDRAWADAYLASVRERLRKEWSGTVSTSVHEGHVVDEIARDAEAWNADLVVMTTHGRGGVSRLWLGSVADRFVRGAAHPVLLIRPDTGEGATSAIRRLVVPLDGSQLAEQALSYAVTLSRLLRVPIVLIRVSAFPPSVQTPHASVTDLGQQLLAEDREQARRYLDAQVARLRADGVDASAVFVTEPGPVAAIVDRAAGELLVMSTHGRGGLERLAFGSVADKVIRSARVPVIVVPLDPTENS